MFSDSLFCTQIFGLKFSSATNVVGRFDCKVVDKNRFETSEASFYDI